MVLNGLFPVFALILLGYLLKRIGLTNDSFLKTSDKLVYYIFFPALLFWKIGGTRTGFIEVGNLAVASLSAGIIAYIAGALVIRLANIGLYQAGTFSQGCYRFNTYVGMAVAMTAIGDIGVRVISILIGFMIPLSNMLAVTTLIWYSGKKQSPGRRLAIVTREIFTNPLILACLAGFLYAQTVNAFPVFLENTLSLLSLVTLPLALLSVGGSLTASTLRAHLPAAAGATAIKIILLPAAGYLLLRLCGVTGTAFQTTMLFLALPISPATYVLSAQLNSDTQLASAIIAVSTILSFFSLSVVLLLFF